MAEIQMKTVTIDLPVEGCSYSETLIEFSNRIYKILSNIEPEYRAGATLHIASDTDGYDGSYASAWVEYERFETELEAQKREELEAERAHGSYLNAVSSLWGLCNKYPDTFDVMVAEAKKRKTDTEANNAKLAEALAHRRGVLLARKSKPDIVLPEDRIDLGFE